MHDCSVIITSLLRRRIPPSLWKGIHWTSYLLWALAILHALGTGTDKLLTQVVAGANAGSSTAAPAVPGDAADITAASVVPASYSAAAIDAFTSAQISAFATRRQPSKPWFTAGKPFNNEVPASSDRRMPPAASS